MIFIWSSKILLCSLLDFHFLHFWKLSNSQPCLDAAQLCEIWCCNRQRWFVVVQWFKFQSWHKQRSLTVTCNLTLTSFLFNVILIEIHCWNTVEIFAVIYVSNISFKYNDTVLSKSGISTLTNLQHMIHCCVSFWYYEHERCVI